MGLSHREATEVAPIIAYDRFEVRTLPLHHNQVVEWLTLSGSGEWLALGGWLALDGANWMSHLWLTWSYKAM